MWLTMWLHNTATQCIRRQSIVQTSTKWSMCRHARTCPAIHRWPLTISRFNVSNFMNSSSTICQNHRRPTHRYYSRRSHRHRLILAWTNVIRLFSISQVWATTLIRRRCYRLAPSICSKRTVPKRRWIWWPICDRISKRAAKMMSQPKRKRPTMKSLPLMHHPIQPLSSHRWLAELYTKITTKNWLSIPHPLLCHWSLMWMPSHRRCKHNVISKSRKWPKHFKRKSTSSRR